jgi:hypothetical protein
MYYFEELTINQIIIHILDNTLSRPILSTEIMPSSYDTNEFFANHILKVLNDDSIKDCVFTEDYNMFLSYLKEFQNDDDRFVDFSVNAANSLYAIMLSNVDIPACDLSVVKFYYKGTKYVALLKMNYQSAYIHHTDFEDNVNINSIMQYKTTLPSLSQRLSEAVIINMSSLEVKVLEKKYEIEGAKVNYLSTLFLKCSTKLSSKEQYNIVKKATDKIAKKFYNEDIEKKMDVKQSLYKNIEDDGHVNLDKFANDVFENNVEFKETFKESLIKNGLEEPVIKLEEKTITRSFVKQKIKTDSGIEINIPMEIYNDSSMLEIITDDSGKLSIVIKNINKLLS